MRLIDADKLTPENTHIIERIETVDGYKIKTYEIICDAPTVEPCEDAISREAALDAVNNVLAPFIPILWGSPMAIPLEIARAINDLPSVQPQKPKGKWIYHDDWASDGECCYECSVCGRAYDYDMNYCGCCGVDMRGDENE